MPFPRATDSPLMSCVHTWMHTHTCTHVHEHTYAMHMLACVPKLCISTLASREPSRAEGEEDLAAGGGGSLGWRPVALTQTPHTAWGGSQTVGPSSWGEGLAGDGEGVGLRPQLWKNSVVLPCGLAAPLAPGGGGV